VPGESTIGIDLGRRSGTLEVRVAALSGRSVLRTEVLEMPDVDAQALHELRGWLVQVIDELRPVVVVIASHDAGGGAPRANDLVERLRVEGALLTAAGSRSIPVQHLAGATLRAAVDTNERSNVAAVRALCASLHDISADDPCAKAAAAAHVAR
jgi:hypothetical protein